MFASRADLVRAARLRPELAELKQEIGHRFRNGRLAYRSEYPLFPNAVVAESLLDRLINTSHQVFMNGPSYRPNKRPRGVADDKKQTTG